MITPIKRILLPALILTISFTCWSQDFQGIITYQTKTTIDMNNFGGGRLSEQQKQQFAERMRSRLEKVFTLTFNKNESIYEEEEKLETPGNRRGGGFRFFGGGFGQSSGTYKNITDNVYAQETELSSKRFLIKDELPSLEWKMENESKMIGEYVVFKATATREVEDFGFRGRRFGRNGQERRSTEKDSTKTENKEDDITINIPKEETITVWYTPQIPIGHGPDNYWGLPGLILEVNAGRTTILCNKIVLNPKENITIKIPSKGKEVKREEYTEIVKKQLEEMRERFGGQRGRNGRRGF